MNAESAIYLIFYSEGAARKENHVHAAPQMLASGGAEGKAYSGGNQKPEN